MYLTTKLLFITSPPTWVVWIEIHLKATCEQTTETSPPTWVVWIEIVVKTTEEIANKSHHPHGWCGLKSYNEVLSYLSLSHHPHGWCGLKSHNRNLDKQSIHVTTHTGGVDWNLSLPTNTTLPRWSPPTRVVWIEIGGWLIMKARLPGHHPHGWCGLKC